MSTIRHLLVPGILLISLPAAAQGWSLDTEFGPDNYLQLTADYHGYIVINASNVTLDLGGHSIIGDNIHSGIVISNRSNVTVQNGYIRNSLNGLHVIGGSGHTFNNLVSSNNIAEGFLIENMGLNGNSHFNSCTSHDNGEERFKVDNSDHLDLDHVQSHHNGIEGFSFTAACN